MVVRYSEPDRRKLYARPLACKIFFQLLAIAAGTVAAYYIIDPAQCRADQAVEFYSVCYDCEMEFCTACKEAGKLGCDTGACQEGYYFDTETGLCTDATCQMKHCVECTESGPTGCDRCDRGFELN